MGCLKLTYGSKNELRLLRGGACLTSENTAEKVRRSYIYGFNGKELDNEVSGEGNSYDFGNRMYDNRLGRFLSLDNFANKFPYQSPYIFAANSPIWATDVEGDSVLFYSSNAVFLGYSNDNYRYEGKNLLVIIDEGSVKNFNTLYNNLKNCSDKELKTPNGSTPSIYRQGLIAGLANMSNEIYDVSSFVEFFDKYSKLMEKDGKDVPYEGEFPPEWQANLMRTTLNKGKYNQLIVIQPNASTADTDNDVEAVQLQNRTEGMGAFHIHSAAGSPQGPGAPGDFEYARHNAKNIFNVVVSQTQFNLYKSDGGEGTGRQQRNALIAIQRKAKDGNLTPIKFTSNSNQNAGITF